MSSFSKSISLTSINAGSPREAFEGVRNDGPEKSAAFDAAWQREQRRAAFIRKRTDPQTGGHVRVLNKTFNR